MSTQFQLLNSGFCYHPERVVIKDGAWKNTRFPSTFALIQHPHLGLILFDTGYAERFFKATDSLPFRIYRWVTPVHTMPEESAIAQLDALGISSQDIQFIFISHFHADHIAGLKDFPNARFLCSHSALEDLLKLNDWQATKAGFLKSLLPSNFEERCHYFETYSFSPLPQALWPFEKGHDLAGDGSLFAIPLPGHHGLYCETETEAIFLIGDACWHQRSFQKNIGPHPITQLIMKDFQVYQHTINQLSELHKNNPNVQIIPTHCPEMHANLVGN
jgi:glyoxylase-like metal-dependent hydrolase (beta-lactamase superfamily II)